MSLRLAGPIFSWRYDRSTISLRVTGRKARYTAALVIGLCVALASCGDFVGPAMVGQTYALVSINGEPLPLRTWEDDSTAYVELRSDTLVFRDADSVAFSTVLFFVTETEESDWSGTSTKAYERLPGNKVVISKACPPMSCSCIEDYVETGVISEERLVTNRRVFGVEEERVFVRVNGG